MYVFYKNNKSYLYFALCHKIYQVIKSIYLSYGTLFPLNSEKEKKIKY